MYVLNSNIVIETQDAKKLRFKVHEVKINKSLNSYVDKAVIKVPISSRLKTSGVVSTESVQTAKLFNEGDKVVIELGYNGKLTKEFEGFVSRVNFSSPVEIECEGFAYQLRHKSLQGYWKEITVKELLELMITGTDIVLDSNIPAIPIPNFSIPEQPLLGILDYLKEHCMLSIYFKGNVLFANLKYETKGVDVKHRLGWNVLKDSDLKVRKAGEVNVQVNFTSEKKDGTKAKASSGDAGGKVINRRTVVTDESWLKQMADKKLSEYKFDGYEGKITTFLLPFAQPGDNSVLEDKRYTERGGKYIIESTDVTYSVSGARRINELGLKVG